MYLHKGDANFSEHMIRNGFSSYCGKYGNAVFHQAEYEVAPTERAR